MKYLLLFESFLEGNYSPLYHYTKDTRFRELLESDVLKMAEPAVIGPKCVCVTRSSTYTLDTVKTFRFKLDQDKLRKDGYTPISVDEFLGKDPKRKMGKAGRPSAISIEWEFEERIYKDIKNFGKYVISIQFPNDVTKQPGEHWITGVGMGMLKLMDDLKSGVIPYWLKSFLNKYPHIELEYYDVNKRWKTTPMEIN